MCVCVCLFVYKFLLLFYVFVMSGGCPVAQKPEVLLSPEEQQEGNRLAEAIISDDPHAVLVEFSSVADTQEYIIGVSLLHTLIVFKHTLITCQ